jgi:hypothetical protein
MAGIDTAAAVAQRTAELLDDRTVREELDRALRNSRDALRRTKKRGRKAPNDPIIRRRVVATVRAGREVFEIAREGPARRRRRRRRGRALALLAVGGAAIATATRLRSSR